MSVLVTGGAGYIGSHMVLELLNNGEEDVLILDDLSTGSVNLMPDGASFIPGDVGDATLLADIIQSEKVDRVLHFAGSIVVSESVKDPAKYIVNNAVKTGVLAQTCAANGVDRFVFSSTAAVYGEPEVVPIREDNSLNPVNPYGLSKLCSERAVREACDDSQMSCAVLRYFNVAGADPLGRSGQSGNASTHLIKIACEAATGKRESMSVFGANYNTKDGTCVRDYIHVSDLARVHKLALDRLKDTPEGLTLNCGYGKGYSVSEVIDAVKRVSGVDFPVSISGRREGDPASLVADSSKTQQLLGWKPQFDDLDLIVSHALTWEKALTSK